MRISGWEKLAFAPAMMMSQCIANSAAAAIGIAAHGGNDGLGAAFYGSPDALGVALHDVDRAGVLHALDVAAGGEYFVAPGQHDDPHRRIVRDVVKASASCACRVQAQRIGGLGPIQQNKRHAFVWILDKHFAVQLQARAWSSM